MTRSACGTPVVSGALAEGLVQKSTLRGREGEPGGTDAIENKGRLAGRRRAHGHGRAVGPGPDAPGCAARAAADRLRFPGWAPRRPARRPASAVTLPGLGP